jgi:bifunctional DNA-binding transcriptional regulator/antitoxin component of YhaV-PrlF toxin-antitoxin module
MQTRKITAGGQVSLPAAVRKRWATSRVAIEDCGDFLVLKPLPDDPVSSARGSLAGKIGRTNDLRRAARADEAVAERRRR